MLTLLRSPSLLQDRPRVRVSPAATPLSGGHPPDPRTIPALSAPERAFRVLARASLACLLAMSSSACLVLSPPEYDRPQRTAPMLVGTEAFPDLRETILIKEGMEYIEFGGAVLSEDDGLPVQLALYIDYGQTNAAGRPYRNVIYPFEPIPPGTLADGARKFQGKRWYLGVTPVAIGCHTVTLVASHEFNAEVCPRDSADASVLVWQVVSCDSSGACAFDCEPPTCDNQPCPSCATIPDAAADGGAL